MPPKKAAAAPPAPAEAAPEVPIDLGPETDSRKPTLEAAFHIYDPEKTGNVLVECVRGGTPQMRGARVFRLVLGTLKSGAYRKQQGPRAASSETLVPLPAPPPRRDVPTIMRYLRMYVTDKEFMENVLPELRDGA
jgi:hypothetical protein